MEVSQSERIIVESAEIIMKSRKLATQLSRCDLILQHAEALMKYERLGIPSITPSPSSVLRDWKAKRDELVIIGLEAAVEAARSKASLATTHKAKLTLFSKSLLQLRECESKVTTSKQFDLNRIEKELLDLMLNAYLEGANKCEFKGQLKKALDIYLDALYFLKTDHIDDSTQREQIAAIEKKVVELGGVVPSAAS